MPMQSFMREHSLNNEVEIISVGVARLGGMYEDIHKLLPQAKMLPRTATWCKTPKVKPNPRASTNPAPGCLSFQNNILYFNGQPVGKGVFYDVLPSEGNEVTNSGSDERILKSH